MPGTLTTGQGVKEMEEKKLFAVLQEERELLHKQLQLLAEQSKSCTPTELAKLSEQMVAIYSVLDPVC